MTPQRRNILLFHAGALGDFIVTWPLALALSRIHPQSRLFYVTQRSKGLLAERVLRLESVDSEAGWHPLFAADASPAEPQGRLLAGAHSIISFFSDGNDAWARNVGRLAPDANLLTMTVSPPPDFAGHVTDHLLAQLAPWSAAQAAMAQVLRSIATRGVTNRQGPGDAVVVHPGSGARRKCWPTDRFVRLIERLRADGRDVRVVLGEVELETWPSDEVRRVSAAAQVVQPSNYVELFEQLQCASAYVGNDTGPSHLAGIIGVPTVVLFGASNANHWRPLGPSVQLIQGAGMDAIAVEQVYDVLRGASTRAG